ncbi:site-specific integrase, partial [Mesorhizobium sp. BR1-1-7]|uniref:site-specific integrase n=1 Tax=Mesorhizobium sp. BR1-1-7 TaxID=2876647 RepID=UPI001CCD6139
MPRHAEPPRLYLRKDRGQSVWIIRDGGKDKRTGCTEGERARAENRFAEYLAEKHTARPAVGGKSDTVSIAEVLRVYVMEHAPNTAKPKLIAEHVEGLTDFWAAKKVSSIKGASCRAFAATKTSSMARRELETLRAAVNYFHKEYGLDPVPAFTMPQKHRARERWLTRAEAAALLWAALGWRRGKDGVLFRLPKELRSPHLARFVIIGLYTGTRSGAILGLSWLPSIKTGWLDLEQGILHRSGKGQRETKKRQPPAAIPDRLLAHMRRWKRLDKGIRHVIHWNGSSVLSVKKAFRNARENAKLSNDVIPHTLR